MKIVLLESLGIPQSLLEGLKAPFEKDGHSFVCCEKTADIEKLKANCSGAEVLILGNMPLPGEVIASCDRLKFIDVGFTGVDHVDLEAARAGGVKVSNASGYATNSVAELTVCLMLMLLRHVREQEERARSGGTKAGLTGCELRGKTVGILGTGKIGGRVAELCRAFGCRVLAYSRHRQSGCEQGTEYVPLERLLREADILSLHCPLNAESRGLINARTIASMKDGALLVNMARGPVVVSGDLAEALRFGKLAGAAVDVLETEPPFDPGHPLLEAPHVIVTPHTAFASAESMVLRARIVFENLDAWLKGKQQNVIL